MVERGGLENRYTFTGIGGSNPPLSAMKAESRKQKAESRRQKAEVILREAFLPLLLLTVIYAKPSSLSNHCINRERRRPN